MMPMKLAANENCAFVCWVGSKCLYVPLRVAEH